MDWYWWLGGTVLVLVVFDRGMSALEGRGHVHWRRPRDSGGSSTASGTLGDLIEVFQPTRHHLVAEQERQQADIQQNEVDAPPFGIDLDAGTADLRHAPQGSPQT